MKHRYIAPLACCVLLGGTLAANAQQQPAHEHESHHAADAALVSKLALDDGKRWPTDASLRAGMASIRASFDAEHGAIHAGQQTDAQYEALATRIERDVNTIVANCKLPAAADAQLHYVVGDLLAGVALMRGGDPAKSRHAGAARVHGALRAYGKHFDDPDWADDSGAHDHAHH